MSELVTNAVSYARAPVLVQVECVDAHRLLVSVSDGSADFVQRSRASEFEDSFVGGPADLSESGRGLRLLRDFAGTWGVRTSSSGKSIWFELWMT